MMSKILLVDDDATIHALLKVHLLGDPMEVRSAFDGAAALRLIAHWQPDLILLDIDMRDLNGFEVCQRLRENPSIMNVPVIFLTSVSAIEQKVFGLEMGACDYITKPFDPSELLARVHVALRAKTRMDALANERVTEVMASGALPRSAPRKEHLLPALWG
jgi:DNA-binding response OmpR family regulator